MQIVDGIPIWGDPVDEGALAQIKNCAKTAAAVALMGDHHKGYAVPIGGVVAYENAISPSGVGFDIACIAENSLVTLADGRSLQIEDVQTEALTGADAGLLVNVGAPAGRKISTRDTIAITLSSGDRIRLTPDHQMLTPLGWRTAGELHVGSHTAVSSFRGVLCSQGAPPMQVAYMRLLGYVMGDGTLARSSNRVSVFTSKDEDVPSVSAAFRDLGLEASSHRRIRKNGSIENHVYVNSEVLHSHMVEDGCPVGKKYWMRGPLEKILRLPMGLQSAWLSGLFSAEMVTPWALPTQVCSPAFKQGGARPLNLLNVMALSLAGFGFETSIAPSVRLYKSRQTYVLQILGGQSEFVRLWRTIGFCFCAEKRLESARMMSIAWQRDAEIRRLEQVRELIRSLRARGEKIHRVHEMAGQALGRTITKSVALKAVYLDRGKPRTTKRFVPYTTNEIVWTTVEKIEHAGPCVVHDIPLTHQAHNFIASGVIVHNCGNKAVLTDMSGTELRSSIGKIMDDIWATISFGIGRNNNERVEHPLFDRDHPGWHTEPAKSLKRMAENQLGTVGSGNHYVDLFTDEADRVWIGVHFGSRGLGHKIATYFLQAGGAKDGMDVDPLVLSTDSDLGSQYIEAMRLAGEYAYAGRDWVCGRVAKLLGASVLDEVHNHHNFAWLEEHTGRSLWVVRKGATPAFPGQKGFVGGSMGDNSVILEGIENDEAPHSLYSTVHGAGRVMGRNEAKGIVKKGRVVKEGKITPQMMNEWVSSKGVTLRGAGCDESPHCYKRLPDVLAAHAGSIRVLHLLTPVGVAMAGADLFDPYKD